MLITDRLPNTVYERLLIKRLDIEHDPLWLAAVATSEGTAADACRELDDDGRDLAARLSLSMTLARACKSRHVQQTVSVPLREAFTHSAGLGDAIHAAMRGEPLPEGLSESDAGLVRGFVFRRVMSRLPRLRGHSSGLHPFEP